MKNGKREIMKQQHVNPYHPECFKTFSQNKINVNFNFHISFWYPKKVL